MDIRLVVFSVFSVVVVMLMSSSVRLASVCHGAISQTDPALHNFCINSKLLR